MKLYPKIYCLLTIEKISIKIRLKGEIKNMQYQKLFEPKTPYVATSLILSENSEIPLHYHYEFEIVYCISGSFEVLHNGTKKIVSEGDIILINSMTAHSFIVKEPVEIFWVEFGPLFLKENFKILSELDFNDFVLDDKNSDLHILLCGYFKEIIEENKKNKPSLELAVIKNLYGICVALIDAFSKIKKSPENKCSDAIEKSLEMIYHNFAENLTVEKAAKETGYGVANFCKIFKKTTGIGFHEYLNNYRIKTACHLLVQTNFSVGKVSETVGFNETKTFCRVFKKIVGISPGQYRNENK